MRASHYFKDRYNREFFLCIPEHERATFLKGQFDSESSISRCMEVCNALGGFNNIVDIRKAFRFFKDNYNR